MTFSLFDAFETTSRPSSTMVGLAALALVAGLGGCSSDDGSGPKKAKRGGSCQSTSDCKKPLRCRSGTCKGPSTTTDGGPPGDATADAGGNGTGDGTSTDTGPSFEAENYYMSYTVEDLVDSDKELRVYSTESEEETVVNPSSVDCSQNCWLTRDLSHFVYTKRGVSTGSREVYVAEVGANLKASGEGERILQSVRDVTLRGNHLVYARSESNSGGGNASGRTIYYRKIGESGSETEVGPTGESGDSDWFVDPERDVVAVYDRSQSGQISFQVGSTDDWTGSQPIVIDGRKYKQTPTGLFGGIGATAVSRDGRILAFSIVKGPNNYSQCTRDNKSDPYSVQDQKCGPSSYGFRCGTGGASDQGRCTRLETTIYFVDLKQEFRERLGSECSSEGSCGPYQKCYIPGNNVDQARCLPGRVTVGATAQEGFQGSACSIAESDPLVDFTGITGPLSFDDDGNLYAVGVRDRSCLSENYSNDQSSQVIRIDPERRTNFDLTTRDSRDRPYERVVGLNPDQAFEPGQCYDDATGFTLDTCGVFVGEVRVSPNGQELAYTGTNPNSGRNLAREKLYLWHQLRDGSQKWAAGNDKNISDNNSNKYQDLRVHPPRR
jgi:hypothetical protein